MDDRGPLGEDVVPQLLVRATQAVAAQISRLERLEDKASQVFRFNSAAVGLLGVMATVSAARGPGPGGGTVGGAFLLAALVGVTPSGVMALLAYRARKYGIGLRVPSLVDAARSGLTAAELRRSELEGLAAVFEHNERALATMARRIEESLWVLAGALVVLAVGAMVIWVLAVV